jgi:hypothetical protein
MLYIHAEGGPPVIVNGSSANSSSVNSSSGNGSSNNGSGNSSSAAAVNDVMPIQVFKHLEINIFPGTSYTLELQVCNVISRHLHFHYELCHHNITHMHGECLHSMNTCVL